MTGDRLRLLENTRLGTNEIKRNLLRTLAAMYVGEVLVFIDAMYKSASF
jgi:L-fucose mutarotase/ribose pyranase (RbsD/FucU family)